MKGNIHNKDKAMPSIKDITFDLHVQVVSPTQYGNIQSLV